MEVFFCCLYLSEIEARSLAEREKKKKTLTFPLDPRTTQSGLMKNKSH